MVIELFCISLGVPIGYTIKNNRSLIKVTDYSLLWSVRILLLLLGLSQGSSGNLLQQLDTLGFQASIITFWCIVGSLIVARLLNYFIYPFPYHN